MLRISLLVIIGAALSAGWTWTREQEMLNHPKAVQMEEMQSASCPPTTNPPGGG